MTNNKKSSVLIVDDMQENLMLLSDILKDRYQVKIAKSGEKALEIVEKGDVDLILLDVVMPNLDGYEVCKILQKSESTKDIPIIFVTGNSNPKDEKKGFELGAVDYITKPFSSATVRARVKTHMNLHLRQLELEELSEILKDKNKELQKYIEMVEKISITDGLTNIYNRRHFNDTFPKVINSAKRKDELVCFLLLDIDNFKQYNDNYGHQAGDDALIKFSSCLKDNLKRSDDVAFRLGGEEFGILFKSDSKQKAIDFAQMIREKIENLKIPHEYSSASKYLTASIGLVCEKANKIENEDRIYKLADNLLYKSKESGRNKVSV
ncbi:MAG: GGDEF domain-containing response regulator [Campylobacterota bacterium]